MSDSDFTVDAYNLDKEWVRQPELYHDYAERAADARRDYDKAKAKLDIVKAEIYQRVLQENEKKPTEKAIEALIITHPDHKAALKLQIDSKHTLDRLNADVAALDQKKHALQKLVELHIADYYSRPKATTDQGKEETEKIRNRSRVERMQKRRR